MNRKIKSEIQIFLTLLAVTVALIFISSTLRVDTSAGTGAAPPPEITETPYSFTSFHNRILNEFGVSTNRVQTEAVPNLQVSVSPSSMTKSPNDSVSFTVTIKNLSSTDEASYIYLYQSIPESLNITGYTPLNLGATVSDDASPTWFFEGPIPAGGEGTLTIQGNMASDSCEGMITYTAQAAQLFQPDNILTSGSTEITVINGAEDCAQDILFPIIFAFPTPTPSPTPPLVYTQDFNNEDDDWPKGEFNSDDDDDGDEDCSADYSNGKYEVKARLGDTCFFPGPEEAERRTGTFEVDFKRDGDSDSEKFDAGIYINGKGGDNYYLFRIEYNRNTCNWELFRKDNSISGGPCNGSNGYNNNNIIKITHASSGQISVYLNDIMQHSFFDSAALDGRGTGIYLRERSDNDDDVDEIIVDFDNFKVFSN